MSAAFDEAVAAAVAAAVPALLAPLGAQVQTLRAEIESLRAELANRTAATEPLYLSVPEAAERYGVCPRTITRRINDGTLRPLRVGAVRRLAVLDLERAFAPTGPRGPVTALRLVR